MFDQLLQETRRYRVELWLVGDDAGDAAEVERYVDEHNLQALVRVVGRCSDEILEHLYTDADIFALPSQSQSFALGVTEAMAHGLPVVTYKVGSVPSRLTAGALTVPPNDEQAFREALTALIRNPGWRVQLGREGQELMRECPTWRTIADQFLGLYERHAHEPSESLRSA
jgi:glycosyltransferase involved in cell wall biosynthesis